MKMVPNLHNLAQLYLFLLGIVFLFPLSASGVVSVTSPAYRSDVSGNTTIQISAPGQTSAVAKCWQAGSGMGQDTTVATISLDGSGNGSFVFPADSYPHGPLIIRITAGGDTCHLQLYNTGGTPWKEGLASAPPPPQAAGLVLAFADDFDGPLSISQNGFGTTYGAHMVPASKDFSRPRFRNYEDSARNPFFQRDSYLRIRATTVVDEAGLEGDLLKDAKAANWDINGMTGTGFINSVDQNREGFKMRVPFYMECRFIAQRAKGTWPAFWALSIPNGSEDWGELDVIEAYGSNNNNQYWTSYHIHPGSKEKGDKVVLMDAAGIGGPATLDWSASPQTYGCLVTETTTTFYLNDVEVWNTPTKAEWLNQEFFFMINYALAGQSGWLSELGRYGFQSDMYVDWVRVYDAQASVTVPAASHRWQFNGDTTDSVAGANGVVVGDADPHFTQDWIEGDSSLSLDGNGDGVRVGNSSLHNAFTDYSVAVWFKPDTVSGTATLFEEGGGYNGFGLRLNGNSVEARAHGGPSQISTSVSGVVAGEWQLAVATFAGGTLNVYLNDGAIAASTVGGPASVGSHAQPAGIGLTFNGGVFQSGTGDYFDGLIDDVRIWDGTALTLQEAATVYSEAPSFTPGNLQLGKLTITQPLRGAAGEWQDVTFSQPYSVVPVVVASPVGWNGTDDCSIRIRAVTTTGFQCQIDEWDYLDGAHGAETISWLAIEPGDYTLAGRTICARSHDDIDSSWTTKTLTASFPAPPVVIGSVTSNNDGAAAVIRLRNVTATSFDLRLQEQEAGADFDGDPSGSTAHANETVSYIAIESGAASDSGFTSGVLTNVKETWKPLAFGAAFPGQYFFAAMQTFAGSDPCVVRYQQLTDTGVSVMVQEETSADSEIGHAYEQIGWLVFE